MKTIKLINIEKSNVPKFDLEGVNAEFQELTSNLGLLGLPKFNADLSDFSRYDVKTIVRATIVHRATNKWQKPDPTTKSDRRKKSIRGWYANEQRLKGLCRPGTRSTLSNAGLIGREVGYKVLRLLEQPVSLIDFGPGESFHSKRGDTSILAKLEPENHSVSYDNLDLWVKLIITTRGLFKPYMQHWVRMNPKHVNRNRVIGKNWKEVIVRQVIDSLPDYIVQGSRQAFVDKDNDEDRVIEVNPLGDVVLQKVLGNAFRKVLVEYGIDLDNNQQLHRDLISDKSLATIDASKASDTITAAHIQWLLPPKLYKIIIQLSQKFILATTEDNCKEWVVQEKLCSMGSGFTFELLTLMFYSIGRIHTDQCWAYGDDLIVPRSVAPRVVESLELAGFIINRKKTFLDGPLSESCGAFHLETYGYITCYGQTYCNNPVEAVAAINKLGRVLRDYKENFGNDDFTVILEKSHRKLLSITNPAFLGPVTSRTDIPTWVEDSNYLKRQKKSSVMRACRSSNMEYIEGIALNYQMKIEDYTLLLEFSLRNKVRLPPKQKIKYQALIYAYIKSNRRTKFEIKDRNPQVLIKLRLVDRDGFFVN